jgi:hypothetical protein
MCRIRASEREDRTPSGDAAALRQSLPLEFDAHFKEGSMGATLTVDSRKNAMVSHTYNIYSNRCSNIHSDSNSNVVSNGTASIDTVSFVKLSLAHCNCPYLHHVSIKSRRCAFARSMTPRQGVVLRDCSPYCCTPCTSQAAHVTAKPTLCSPCWHFTYACVFCLRCVQFVGVQPNGQAWSAGAADGDRVIAVADNEATTHGEGSYSLAYCMILHVVMLLIVS